MQHHIINKHRYTVAGILILILVVSSGCGRTSQKTPGSNDGLTANDIASTPASAEKSIAEHYWDNFNFTDTSLISKPEITEQAFADFIYMLPHMQPETADKALTAMMDAASANKAMFFHFTGLAEKYLYDPNSPYRNEDHYIAVLQYIISSPLPGDLDKIRPRSQLEMALKNRPGTIAADFVYTLGNGTKSRMRNIKSDYTLLFFNNPDCQDCKRVKQFINTSPVFSQLTSGTSLSILAFYPDADLALWKEAYYPSCIINGYDGGGDVTRKQTYDLRAIPCLYLLGKDKRVILKDAPVEVIEEWLKENVIPQP